VHWEDFIATYMFSVWSYLLKQVCKTSKLLSKIYYNVY